ncbi:MAG: type II toxin-antitoxin system RelE/ParE family toxin [Leptolyngbyaceae cyanobacterium SM2_5_2]|nr:type II toxin-antitoxin system RelE/ParE family toxin [Leptolyngbyaceae cyanobacterium SM2_5_2]
MSANLPIFLDSRAEEDLDAAAQWYAQQSAELALEFLDAVDAAFGFIAQFSKAGREVADGIRRVLTKKFPFCVYYKVDDGQVVIVAVLHFRRSPEAWQQRLE